MSGFFASLAGKLVLAAIVVVALLFGVSQCQSARQAGQTARLSDAQAGAASDNAADAIDAVGGLHARDNAGDALTKENADAILNAPGAAAPVDPVLDDVARRSLCKRAAYRGSEQCLQFAPAGGVETPGAGGSAP